MVNEKGELMSKDKTHKIKESRIKELAKECPEHFEAMKILFPEAFKVEKTERDVTRKCSAEFYVDSEGVGRIRIEHQENRTLLISTSKGSTNKLFDLPIYGMFSNKYRVKLFNDGIKVFKKQGDEND